MELFLFFLLTCFAVGVGSIHSSPGRQAWVVAGLVVVITILYFSLPSLI